MITTFEIFESEYYTDEDINRFKQNIPKFIKFIRKFISNLGFENINMSNNYNEYLILFYLKGTATGLFKIITLEHDSTIIFDSFGKSDNILVSAIPGYLKSINGITYTKKIADEYEFYINGDVNDIINQITEEKLMLFASSKKFNL